MPWWLEKPNPKGLSQGDIVKDVLTGVLRVPVAYLGRATLTKSAIKYWPEVPQIEINKSEGTGFYISRGRPKYVMVVSHSCELDKNTTSGLVLVVPIAPIETISDPALRDIILAQRKISFLPLPDIPALATCYADFRQTTYVPRSSVLDANRIASMTDQGELRLQAQLVGFYTRRSLLPR